MYIFDISWQPFNNLTESELKNCFDPLNCDTNRNNFDFDHLNHLVFDQFSSTYNDYNCDLDPDLNFFVKNLDMSTKCEYCFLDSLNVPQVENNNLFSILNLNINSLSKNLDSFVSYFKNMLNFQLDVVSFCETKLSDEIDELFTIEGFNKFTLNNQRSSGGLAIFIKKSFSDVFIRNELTKRLQCIESFFVEIEQSKKNIIIGVIYRRPGTSANDFNVEMESILNIIKNENKRIYITGDFNFNLLNADNDNDIKHFIDSFHSNNLFNVITKPTRVTSTSATILDHIWTNDIDNCVKNSIVYTSISDHFPIFSSFSFEPDQKALPSESIIYFRNFNESSINNFKFDLSNVDWHLTYTANDPNISYDNFILIFQSLFDKHFPLTKKLIKHKPNDLPYITPEIKQMIKEKNRLQRLAAKWPLTYRNQYKYLRNQVTKQISIAKFEYYKDKLSRCAGYSKGTWRVINEVMKRNTVNNVSVKSVIDKNDIYLTDSLDKQILLIIIFQKLLQS